MKVDVNGDPLQTGITQIVVDEDDIIIHKDDDNDSLIELELYGGGCNYLNRKQVENLVKGLQLALKEFKESK